MTDKYACLGCGFVGDYNEFKRRVDQKKQSMGVLGSSLEMHGFYINHKCTKCGHLNIQRFEKDKE